MTEATEKKQVHHTDKVRRSAWRIVCAGGYLAAGFHGTIGHSDVWNRVDAPSHYTFTVRDEGAGAQLGALHDFFTALPFWRMCSQSLLRDPSAFPFMTCSVAIELLTLSSAELGSEGLLENR